MASSASASGGAGRDARRAEKQKKVGAHRAEILRRLNQTQKLSKLHKADTFIAPVRFENRLPEIPVEQRYMAFPFDEDVVYAYDVLHGVSSEVAAPRTFHPEPDVGVGAGFGLLDPSMYLCPPAGAAVHPTDAAICSAEFAAPASVATAVRVDSARVEWLMRSQLIHNDLYDAVYKHSDSTAAAAAQLERRGRVFLEAEKVKRPQRVDATFAAAAALDATIARGELRHPHAPTARVSRVWTLLPETMAAGVPLIEVAFDGDPDEGDGVGDIAVKRARLTRACVRQAPLQPTGGAPTVQLLLPAPSSGGAGTADAGVEQHSVTREYTIESTTPALGEQQFALVWHSASGIVTFSPVLNRAALVRTTRATGGEGDAGERGAVFVQRRALLPEEADALAEASARATQRDASATIAAVGARRREVQAQRERERLEREASLEAAAEAARVDVAPPTAAQSSYMISDDMFDAEGEEQNEGD